MEFKRTYTKEDIAALEAWMDTNPAGALDLGDGIRINSMEQYVAHMRNVVGEHYANPTYAGAIATLFRAKEAYERQQKE